MKALEIVCPACGADPKQQCYDVGCGDEQRNASGMHVSRVRRAHYMTVAEKRDRRARRSAGGAP